MKFCPGCGTEKENTDFHARKASPDGLQIRCISCCKKWVDARRGPPKKKGPPRRLSDEERYARKLESRKRSYAKNKVRALAMSALYRFERPSGEKVTRRAHYQKNKKRVALVTEAYRLANLALYRAAAAKRRAAKLGATPAWANLDKIALIYDAAASLSEFMGAPYEVDHIVPLQSKFVCGLHCEANLEIIPREDNRSKGNFTWPDR
jgi:hypothetical protein